MTCALVGLSHSPLVGKNDPASDTLARINSAIEHARSFVHEFRPELVVLYAPDHYNGFFYKEMPPFCLATEAHAVGDFGSPAGQLSVDSDAAQLLARGVLSRNVDLTVSARMTVDHGFTQPLEMLFGGIDRVPMVPIFINGVAGPFGPLNRIRALGTALGHEAAALGRRVLFLASGGLSHDPPVPVLQGAPPRVADALIEGHPPSPEQRARGEERVLAAGREYAAGSSSRIPINPIWDNEVLDTFESGDLEAIDSWTPEWMGSEGGGSAHEVRTWVAAYSSLAASGPYQMLTRFYAAVPEWIAGFAVSTAMRQVGP